MLNKLLLRQSNRVLRWFELGNVRAYHSSWSPLASRFNANPIKKPVEPQSETGLFGVPELKTTSGFKDITQNVVVKTESLIAEALSPSRSRKMTQIFDEMSDELCKVADLAEFVRLAHPREDFRQAAEESCQTASTLVEQLNTHKTLFGSLEHVVMHGDKMPTTAMDQHVAKMFMYDFQQCGIHRDDKDRKQIVDLNYRIMSAGQYFMSQTLNPRYFPTNIVPDKIARCFPVVKNKLVVSALNADSDNPAIREAAYKLFLYPDQKQKELLTEILQCRQELATICGFPTYAHRALASSTVESPELVNEFIEATSKKLRPIANSDFSTLLDLKQSQYGKGFDLQAWDVPYYSSAFKKNWLKASTSEYSPYFSLGACMEGINHVFQSLYGVTFQYAESSPGEIWHHDVYKLDVVHETEGQLGTIYCDFYDRPGKPNQDSHFTIRGGKALANGTYQNPIVVVLLSMPSPRWNGPTLLSPPMVDNLFHELGHAMHSMLGRTEYQHVTGTRCSTDFAEVPSILMEYFTSDERVLNKFARHYQTGQAMPTDQLKRLCASKHLLSASETQLQLFYSAMDQKFHGNYDEWVVTKSSTDILREMQERYYSVPYVEGTAWQLRFTHLVGYGAKYYSYLVSRAIASSIWYTYFEKDPLNREQGERFRRECLAYGGGLPSKRLVENFLKQEITPSYLADNLIGEIEGNNHKINTFQQT